MDKEKIKELCDKVEHLTEWAEIGAAWTRDQATSESTEKDARVNLELAHQEEKELLDFLTGLIKEEDTRSPEMVSLDWMFDAAEEHLLDEDGEVTCEVEELRTHYQVVLNNLKELALLRERYQSLKIRAFSAMYGTFIPAREDGLNHYFQSITAEREAKEMTEALDALEHLNKEAREGNIAVYDGEENCEALLQDIKDAYRILWDFITGSNTRNIQNLPRTVTGRFTDSPNFQEVPKTESTARPIVKAPGPSPYAQIFQVIGNVVPQEAAEAVDLAIRQYDGSFSGTPLKDLVMKTWGALDGDARMAHDRLSGHIQTSADPDIREDRLKDLVTLVGSLNAEEKASYSVAVDMFLKARIISTFERAFDINHTEAAEIFDRVQDGEPLEAILVDILTVAERHDPNQFRAGILAILKKGHGISNAQNKIGGDPSDKE